MSLTNSQPLEVRSQNAAPGLHQPAAQALLPATNNSPAADHFDITDCHHSHVNPAKLNSLPIKLPQTPVSPEIGNLIAASDQAAARTAELTSAAQTPGSVTLAPSDAIMPAGVQLSPNAALSCHEGSGDGNQIEGDALTELFHRAVTASKVTATQVRRGRPAALDEQGKGRLIALLSVGMSMRQAAAVLGVSHTTVQKTLKAEPALAEEITAARFQAQLQPLACIIRESRRSWKAATWLLKYLDAKIAGHEETPDERRDRQRRETDEILNRNHLTPQDRIRRAKGDMA
jgi:hypothetical protein